MITLLNQAVSIIASVVLVRSGVGTGYDTPELAQASAVAGDCIFVYKDFTTTSLLGKDGVDWWFAPGVTITNSTTGVFGDGNAAMTYNIYGSGTFVCSLALTPTVHFQHTSTVVTCFAQKIQHTGTGNSPAFRSKSTTRFFLTDGFYSATYDGWWAEAGDNEAHAPNFIGSTTAAQANGVEVWAGRARVFATLISGKQAGVRFDYSPTSVYIEAAEITKSGAGTSAIYFGTGTFDTVDQFVIRCPKVTGTINIDIEAPQTTAKAFRLIDATIDGSATATAGTILPIDVGMVLDNCEIISHADDVAIYSGGGAVTLYQRGDFIRNKALGAGVTVTVLSASNP